MRGGDCVAKVYVAIVLCPNPDCGKKMADTRKKCPKCGTPIVFYQRLRFEPPLPALREEPVRLRGSR